MLCSRSDAAAEPLDKFIAGLSHQDIVGILTPVRCQLLTEDTLLAVSPA